MISLRPMTNAAFEEFRVLSQEAYAKSFCVVEGIAIEEGLKNVAQQFVRLVPDGLSTPGQLFFEAIEIKSAVSVGYLWLGISERFGRKVASINDIMITSERRGQGLGKELMKCVEQEAKKAGARRVRLHVFQKNAPARKLYESMGFEVSSVDMFKLL